LGGLKGKFSEGKLEANVSKIGLDMSVLTMDVLVFKRLSLIAVITAFCVVVLGAYVRLSDAGLGCPDWPGCYGTLTVPESQEAIAKAQTIYPDSPVETSKAWKEMLHRYLAGSLGLMVLGLAVLGWKAQAVLKTSPWLTSGLLLLIMMQAMLGMWTVTMLLKPVIVSLHLLGGMSTLGLLTWLTYQHWTTPKPFNPSSTFYVRLVRISLIVLVLQLLLGAWTSTNYAALACTDFPTCHGVMMPSMDFKDAFHFKRELGVSLTGGSLTLEAITAIQWSHRVGAVVTLLVLGSVAIIGLRQQATKVLSLALLIALVLQISIGIANLILHLPTVLAVLHNAGAATLVVILVTLNARLHQSKANK
jgi:heme a synthase